MKSPAMEREYGVEGSALSCLCLSRIELMRKKIFCEESQARKYRGVKEDCCSCGPGCVLIE
jgi:hypothetical protein